MDALAQSLARSPELFPHSLDLRSDTVTFMRLNEADYSTASFLDDRILTPGTIRRTLPGKEVEQAITATRLQENCHFIFHIGHVGSTLLSRLIGAQAGALSLREPGILRTLAQLRSESSFDHQPWGGDGFDRRLSAFLKLWSRAFSPGDKAIVKATSFVSELAQELLSRPYEPRAILMFVSPESYLATILGGANAPQEAKALAPARLKRLQRRLGGDICDFSTLGIGEIVAMSWACEMTALVRAKAEAGGRALFIDFDAYLCHPFTALSRAFHHLALSFRDEDIETLISGPETRRYSKAPEYAYDAKLRGEVLNQARAASGAEIGKGLIWLDRLSREHAAVREALELSG